MATPASDVTVRYGLAEDFDWLLTLDGPHVDDAWIKRCLAHNEYILAIDKNDKNQRLGYIRFSMFWGVIPYLDMIRVIDGQQRRGVGSAMFTLWENDMRAAGYKVLMTSSLRDELEPQNWHWRNGFRESGKLEFGSLAPNETEVFFIKELVLP